MIGKIIIDVNIYQILLQYLQLSIQHFPHSEDVYYHFQSSDTAPVPEVPVSHFIIYRVYGKPISTMRQEPEVPVSHVIIY